jgi:hypothetical protein|tara:strand:+ start:246 stop:881 length:636 start_codon:yes stop_codon:yes gene_type:complete
MAQSYSNLTASKATLGSIKAWVNYAEIDADEVLLEAEQWIYKRLRIEDMIAITTGTMAIGTDTVSKPTRWRGTMSFTITGTDKASLKRKEAGEVENAFQYDGTSVRVNEKPTRYYGLASSFQLDSPPDKAYPYRIVHYAALAPLTSSNETNALTDAHPRLLRAACLMQANEILKNPEERAYWHAIAQDAVREANIEDDLNLMGAELEAVLE